MNRITRKPGYDELREMICIWENEGGAVRMDWNIQQKEGAACEAPRITIVVWVIVYVVADSRFHT